MAQQKKGEAPRRSPQGDYIKGVKAGANLVFDALKDFGPDTEAGVLYAKTQIEKLVPQV